MSKATAAAQSTCVSLGGFVHGSVLPFLEVTNLLLPAALVAGEDGRLAARMAKPSPSGDPFSLLTGACYALVPPDTARDDVDSIELSGGARGVDLP